MLIIFTRPKKGLIACLFISLLIVLAACVKRSDNIGSASSNMADELSSWYSGKIAAIQQESNRLPVGSPAQKQSRWLIDRLKKMQRTADWSGSQEFNEDGIQYTLIAVNDDNASLKHPDYELQRLLVFYRDAGGERQFKVVEILGKKEEFMDASVKSVASRSFLNLHQAASKTIGNKNFSILFYDDQYRPLQSFQLVNGQWQKARIRLLHKQGPNTFRVMRTLGQRTTCSGCTTWFLVGIWFDLFTGAVVSYTILDHGEDCGPSTTSPGYGEQPEPPQGEDCTMKEGELAGNAVSDVESISLSESTATTRTKLYHWTIYRQNWGLWQFTSHEKGIHEKTGDRLNPWKWKSLTHLNISRQGLVIGGVIACNLNSSEPYVGMYNAGMQLNYTITASAVCRGFPLSGGGDFASAHVWGIND